VGKQWHRELGAARLGTTRVEEGFTRPWTAELRRRTADRATATSSGGKLSTARTGRERRAWERASSGREREKGARPDLYRGEGRGEGKPGGRNNGWSSWLPLMARGSNGRNELHSRRKKQIQHLGVARRCLTSGASGLAASLGTVRWARRVAPGAGQGRHGLDACGRVLRGRRGLAARSLGSASRLATRASGRRGRARGRLAAAWPGRPEAARARDARDAGACAP
jgi:hypothetical protein